MYRFLCALILAAAVNLSAGENVKIVKEEPAQSPLSYNSQKFELMQQAKQQAEEQNRAAEKKKYILKSALLSAVIPGAGQAYQKSYWKAALFAGLEAAFWTTNIIYNKKAKDEDKRMRKYGDEHWSDHKYWSKVYYDAWQYAQDNPSWTHAADLPQYDFDNDDQWKLLENYNQALVDDIRYLEFASGHTHTLPATKTQQYYEMIYKYLGQFGVGWDDAPGFEFYDHVQNFLEVTPHISKYRSMRDRSNDFYGTADTMFIMSMVNHLVSMFEAAYSGKKNYDKVSYSFRAKPVFSGSEFTAAYGLTIIW